MAIEMNFGWLNDYTGSKFAPITLANLVLLETSSGQTETLFDYVSDTMEKINQSLISTDQTVKLNKENLNLLLVERPMMQDPKDPEKQVYVQTAKAAQRAVRLVSADPSNGDINILGPDNEISKESYLNIGSDIIPTYFAEGVPQICLNNTNAPTSFSKTPTQYEIQDKDNKKVWTNKPEEIILKKTFTTFENDDIWRANALNINISGTARRAEDALNAIYADSANISSQSNQSISLFTDITVGNTKDAENNDTVVGDIVGSIKTTDPYEVTSLDLKTMEWKQTNDDLKIWYSDESVDNTDVISLGNAFLNETTERVFIPSIKIDKKGRIIAAHATDYDIMANLNLNEMKDAAANNKIIYLMGVQLQAMTTEKGTVKDKYYHSKGLDVNHSIYIDASTTEPVLMGAAWNDYAEYRKQKEAIEPGYCVKSNDDGRVEKTTERLSICDGIVSDTFGFSIGKHADYETPLAVSGRVLAYCEGDAHDYHAGDVVCASENGKVSIMTREEIKEYPDRIIGTVSEIPDYDMWNDNKVNGRIWIKVK